jgi:aminopeptidase 2
VAYPLHRLQKLAQSAKLGLLPAEDRIGLISDALAMASSGHSFGTTSTKTSSVLELLGGFEDEMNYFVWKHMLSAIDSIRHAWLFEDQHASLKAFQARLMRKILLQKGWDFSNDRDDMVTQLLKALLFENGKDVPEVKKAAKKMFDEYMTGDEKAIDINIRKAVFQIVLSKGGEKEVSSRRRPIELH